VVGVSAASNPTKARLVPGLFVKRVNVSDTAGRLVGWYVTFTDCVSPGATSNGASVFTTKVLEVVERDRTFSVSVPVFPITNVSETAEPIARLRNKSRDSVNVILGPVALPETGIINEGAVDPSRVASDTKRNPSEMSPANAGVYVNVTTWFCDGASKKDEGEAVSVVFPDTGSTLEIVAVLVPSFLIRTDPLAFPPTATESNVTSVGATARTG